MHPAIKTKFPSIKRYRHIYIGYPTWWGQPPMIIHTLFERYNFKGKTITPFTTSAESPMSSSMPVIGRLAKKDKAKLTKGYRYTTNSGLHNFLVNIGAVKRSKKAKSSKAPTQSRISATNVTTPNPTDSKSLVVYFSMSGQTQRVAEEIQRLTNANIFRIQASDPYPTTYDGYAQRGDNERRNNIHPAIRGTIPNWNQYLTIYVGFPTWRQQPPIIIHTLFDNYSFRGKTIVPFTTSMETPMSSSMPYIRKMAKSKNAKRVINGFRYDNNNAELISYLRRNKLIR
ncbi:flavodoxin [Lactobacillus acidophilus]|uniref:flavodoxin n=1 Tax=uncultured Lactobacillus sp. TaxID=153152 RepID=UPI001300A236|nr:flavodoxin [Lactobacillus acidophilus]MDF4027160.1 flavodoxin [Lactobacillus acidophilus]WJM24471.1 flavodoxin [Lactobacillus acidophilus]WNW04823.1 flavodoxin [Lactobacillus acidophilus]